MSEPATVPSRRWTYDVFLSFRGEDTRRNFTDHLYFAFKEAGINAFRDDNELRRGEEIETELLTAIQESRISVIVFSTNYANSRWCLDELSKIMECRTTIKQWVLPIFYDVDPSDVRKQSGSFAEAFIKHEERFVSKMDMVANWRTALTQAASLSGWDLRNTASGQEARMIREIVGCILNELNHTYLNIASYPVGIDYRVKHVVSLLSIGSNDVRIVGICGMGGLGKTTIAKAVYNQLFHCFQGKSFLSNVREVSRHPGGSVSLQEQLLCDILKVKKLKISSIDRGIMVIKERLCNKRILVVLDDVDDKEQFNIIAMMQNWFGSGSRIIVTTKDEHLLKQIKFCKLYRQKKMDNNESLEFFRWYAFRDNQPTQKYVELSKQASDYCEGVPLALQVLGSFLFDRSLAEWESALEKLRMIPHYEIQRILRMSFDALCDDTEKQIFLDIACFFVDMKKEYVVKILDSCGFFAEIGISVLANRSLLTIDENNILEMHNLVRDMGKEVVREESPNDPGKRSRLWLQDDVLDVLKKQKGTETVEGLVVTLPISLSTESFAQMNKLRLLQLNNIHLPKGYGHISKELRWLFWHKFQLKFIPSDFDMEKLVIMDMQYSNLRQVWRDDRVLGNLRVLNLSHSLYLTRTPDFLKLPNLEKLIIKECTSLVEIHQSVGQLQRLVTLNMKGCKNVKQLPTSICNLKSLEKLNICGCSKIDRLPEDLGNMGSLSELLVDGTAITQVPVWIIRLKNLKKLSLCGCKGRSSSSIASLLWSWVSTSEILTHKSILPDSLLGLSSLTTLNLSDCNLSTDGIPKDLGSLSALVDLTLSKNNFHSLPDSISNLTNLEYLVLDECTNLKSLPELPTNLTCLFASDCTSLERMSSMSKFSYIPSLFLTNCKKLIDIPGLDKQICVNIIHMEGCNNLSSSFKNRLLQGGSRDGSCGISVPGSELPSWLSHQSTGTSLDFQMPHGSNIGFTLCVIYVSATGNNVKSAYPRITLHNKTKDLEWSYRTSVYEIENDNIFLCHLEYNIFRNQIDDGNLMQLSVDSGDELNVKGLGVLICDQDGVYIPTEEGILIKHKSGVDAKRCIVEDNDVSDALLAEEDLEPKRLRSD